MNILLIVIPIIIAGLIALAVIYLKRKAVTNNNRINNEGLTLVPAEKGAISIPIERITALNIVDDKHLTEIKDKSVVARITQTMPTIADIAVKTVAKKALESADIYKVHIPNGETLVQSKNMTGAVRGFFRGANGIKGQANLEKVGLSKITKASQVVNVVNVGSLVVGQYYMSVINDKLETMNKNISKIGDFQDREFKSRIISLMGLVGEVSQFSTEIIENDEVRTQKITFLENMKANATELLGQVNETITGLVQSNSTPEYKVYQEKVDEFNVLVEYQSILLAILEKISELTYLLGKGSRSMNMCYSLYNKYWDLSVQTCEVLKSWHDRQVPTLKIDLEKKRKTKSGFDGVIAYIPALLDENWKYKNLKHGMADKIALQAQLNRQAKIEQKAIYEQDVQIIIKDGKYYYQHGTNEIMQDGNDAKPTRNP